MDKKLLLISHIGDEDGITPIILAKLVFKKVETILLNPGEVDKAYLENVNNYDEIHITDVNVSEDLAHQISENNEWLAKTKVFDHHKSGIELNRYSFITVIDEKNGRKESATSIYYNYLKTISDNEILHKKSTAGLVEQVRLIDTYDFKTQKENEDAHNMDYLFAILGRENYQTYFTEYVKQHDEFSYTEQELFLVKLQKNKIDNYIDLKSKEMFKAKIEGYNVGIVYAESNRSLLGHYLVNKHDDIDFAIIINVARSVSYRGIDKADLSVFSAKRGGGGHKNASGSPLPPNLLQNITKLIFEDIIFENKEEI